jgi:Holliday junction resolvase RusA-like endonuclease
MGRRWETFLAMVPPTVTHNDLEAFMKRGRGGRMVPSIRKSEELREAEDALRARVLAAGVNDVPLGSRDCALAVSVTWCFPRGDHEQGEPHTDKPDMSNMLKTLEDVLARCGVISDDCRIADERLCKAWADPAGIYVLVEEMGEVIGT